MLRQFLQNGIYNSVKCPMVTNIKSVYMMVLNQLNQRGS